MVTESQISTVLETILSTVFVIYALFISPIILVPECNLRGALDAVTMSVMCKNNEIHWLPCAIANSTLHNCELVASLRFSTEASIWTLAFVYWRDTAFDVHQIVKDYYWSYVDYSSSFILYHLRQFLDNSSKSAQPVATLDQQ